MKKLEFEKGAITPFWTKDLEYMQKGFEEVIKVIIEGFSLRKIPFIISGCNITTDINKVSMTSGWAYYGGEVLPVKELRETEFSGRTPVIYFTKNTEYDTEGLRTVSKEDLSYPRNTYKMDYLNPSTVMPPTFNELTGFSLNQSTLNLATIITNRNKIADTRLVTASVVSSVESDLKYRQIGGVVQFYGSVSAERFNGEIAHNMPKPIVDITLNINNILVEITTEGKMKVANLNGTIDLSGITYLSDPIFYLTDN